MLWTALILGFFGSTHCLVMCGPLTLLLANEKGFNFRLLGGKLAYNLGRIFTYGLMGLGIGFLSQQSLIFASQRTISIAAGIVIFVLLFLQFLGKGRFTFVNKINLQGSKLKSWIKQSLKLNFWGSHVTFGLINGALPCGLTYTALASSYLLLNPVDGALYMLIFGIGTIPMMLAASLGFSELSRKSFVNFRKILPYSYAFLAVWLIYRGIVIEPNLHVNSGTKTVECVVPVH